MTETAAAVGTHEATHTSEEYDDCEVIVLNDAETKAAIDNELKNARITREQLEAQAAAGKFESSAARRAWFIVSSLG